MTTTVILGAKERVVNLLKCDQEKSVSLFRGNMATLVHMSRCEEELDSTHGSVTVGGTGEWRSDLPQCREGLSQVVQNTEIRPPKL
jgi:hypothetical protein